MTRSILIAALFLASCASSPTPAQQAAASASAQSALTDLLNGALAYGSGNDIGAGVDAVSALWSATVAIRDLEASTPTPTPTDVASAVNAAGAPQVAVQVAAAIRAQTTAGVPLQTAMETTALKIQTAAISVSAP